MNDTVNGLVSGDDAVRSAREDPAALPEEVTGRVPADGPRLMVYTGDMAVEVARPEEAIAALLQKTQEWGGYLSRRDNATVTVRVPAAKFEMAMATARGLGRVLSELLQADDVTKQHTDLGIRLDNARRARERLTALLAKAEKVEDLLKIEEQLRRVTEEIERMEGELKFLDEQVAMAALTVNFHASAEVVPQQRREPSRFTWINRVGVEHVRRSF